VSNVYYYGSQKEWNSNVNRYSIASTYYPDYYYSACFHTYNSGKWNYSHDNLSVNINYTEYDYKVIKENSCTEDVVSSGTFKNMGDGTKVSLLNNKVYSRSFINTYYLYVS
jgi:hypothetical protein